MSNSESDPTFTFKCNKQLNSSAEKISSFYREQEHFDTVLIAGLDDIKLRAHRLILCAASPYFHAYFRSRAEESKSETVCLASMDGKTVKLVLDFMYEHTIEMREESIEKVLTAASFLKMDTLVKGCCDLLTRQLKASNCLYYALLAEQKSYKNLYEKSLDCVFKNLKEVSDGEDFLKLTETQLSKLFTQNGVKVLPQEILFLCFVKWLKHDPQTRDKSMYTLLNGFVRYSQLEPEFILENAESVAHIAECSKLLFNWLKWHLSEGKRKKPDKRKKPEQQNNPEKRIRQDRRKNGLSRAAQKKLKIILAYNKENVFKVDSYDPDLNKWSSENWPQPSRNRMAYGIVITQKECVIAGGIIGEDYTNSVDCLNLKTMKWRCLPPMITERLEFGMAVLNGVIYVVGGRNDTGLIRLVEKYDFTDNKWTSLAELPVALSWVRAVSVGGKLYVSGWEIRHLKCYDPTTNKWSETPDTIEKSSDFGLAGNKKYVYAVGGTINTQKVNTVERFNPESCTWTVIESMATKRNRLTCVIAGDKLLVCGGDNPKVFEEYNEKTKEWRYLTPRLETSYGSFWFSDHLSTILQ